MKVILLPPSLLLAFYCVSTAFLCQRAQNSAQYCTCGLTGTKQRGIVIYLNLLTAVVLIHPNALLANFASRTNSWLIFSNCTLQVSFCKATSYPIYHQPVLLLGSIPTLVRDSYLPFILPLSVSFLYWILSYFSPCLQIVSHG